MKLVHFYKENRNSISVEKNGFRPFLRTLVKIYEESRYKLKKWDKNVRKRRFMPFLRKLGYEKGKKIRVRKTDTNKWDQNTGNNESMPLLRTFVHNFKESK